MHGDEIVTALTEWELARSREAPRWAFSRHADRYRHLWMDSLEFARDRFPELDGVSVKVGAILSRRAIAGCAAVDVPYVRFARRTLSRFVAAHELTHLLQGVPGIPQTVPRGEKACDLHVMARDPELIDSGWFYLRLPFGMLRGDGVRERRSQVRLEIREALHLLAVEAVERRGRGLRGYIEWFERAALSLSLTRRQA